MNSLYLYLLKKEFQKLKEKGIDKYLEDSEIKIKIKSSK